MLAVTQAPLDLPVLSAYRPAPNTLLWGGYIANAGDAMVSVLGSIGDRRIFLIEGKGRRHEITKRPEIHVSKPGWIQLVVEGSPKGVTGLRLTGSATEGAKFNVKERRNAASVHILWPIPEGEQGEWFYNEIIGRTEPLYTYYMACGFRRGYFGMQVNSPTERRVIFSIWDSGNEAVDRNKVQDENRVRLLAKGKDVYADSFGHEGTGGHSHLVKDWRVGEPQKFLVHAAPEGNTTVYTGYFKGAHDNDWSLIASFRAPKDGHYLSGLYSFIEDFGGEYGYLTRRAEFGPAWLRTKEGKWLPLSTGKFSHDGTGGKDRFDYDFRARRGRFELQNGGFEGASPAYGATLQMKAGRPPKIDFDRLPKG